MADGAAGDKPVTTCARTTPFSRFIERRLNWLVTALRGTLRVLVVDDDEDLLALFTAHLQLCPLFDVRATGTVEDARALADREQWHCWLVDLYVPRREDGMALIRDYAAKVPIVVLSGQSTGGDGYEASRQGIAGFLDKGAIDADTLVRRTFGVALRRLLCPGYSGVAGVEDEALTALFDLAPHTVAQWASTLSVTSRTLEQRVGAISTMRPGTLLAIQSLYSLAFRRCMSRGGAPIAVSQWEARLLRYYRERTLLMDVLSSRRSVRAS